MRLTKGLPDYRFCTDTVTVYHAAFRPEFSCRRTVLNGVYLDERDAAGADAIGATGQRYCFLLAPCGGGGPSGGPAARVRSRRNTGFRWSRATGCCPARGR